MGNGSFFMSEKTKGKKVLVVDDEPDIVNILKIMLETAGYQVATANDGQEAIDAVIKSPPDVVMLDVMMPNVHGYAVCQRIKENKALAQVKVMILTAKSFVADRRLADQVGADMFMGKPLNRDEILAGLEKLLAPPAKA